MDDIEDIRDRFLGNMFLTLSSTLMRLLFGVINIMIIVRNISMEQVGIYVLIQIIVSFFVLTGDFGISISASRFIVSSGDKEKKDWAKTFLFFKICNAVIVTSILYATRPLVCFIFKSDLVYRFFSFVVICYLAQSFECFFTHVLQAFYKYKQIALAGIAITGIRMVLLITIFSVSKPDIVGVLYAFMISLIVGCIFLLPVDILGGKIRISYFKQVRRFGWPIAVENVLSFFDRKIYGLMIALFLGPASLALFEIVNRIPEQLQSIFEAFRSVFFPQIAELFSNGKLDQINDFVHHVLRITGLVTAFLAVIAGLFHEEIISTLFSAQYGHASRIFFYLMIVSYLYFSAYSLGLVLLAGGFSLTSLKIHIIQVIAGIGASVILIPRMGLMGAVFGIFILYTVSLTIISSILKKYGIKVNKKSMLKPIVPFAVSMVLFYVSGVEQILLKFVFVIPFIVISFGLSLISKDDIVIFKNAILSGIVKLKSVKI